MARLGCDGAHPDARQGLGLGLRVSRAVSLRVVAADESLVTATPMACLLTDSLASRRSYKNAQMVFSSLRHLPQYAKLFAPAEKHVEDSPSPLAPIPSIREWQEMIEQAWAAGASRALAR